MKRKIIVLAIMTLAALLATATSGSAQPDTIRLEEIVVRSELSPAGSNTNITGRILRVENAHDGGAMFVNQIGFGVEKRGNYGMEPVLRGFKYGQLNVLIDGGVQTTNACPNRMDPAISQVAMEEIEKIEVIKGPYTVRYGQNLGGIINIVNRKPDRYGDKKVRAIADAGFQSNGNNFYSNVFVQAIQGKFDIGINGGYKHFGNYKNGEGQEIASSFQRSGYAVKLGYNPGENQRIQLSWRQSKAENILYAGLPMDADLDKSDIIALDYASAKAGKTISALKAKVYGSFVDHVMSNKLRPAYMATHSVSPVKAMVLGGRAEVSLQTGTTNMMFVGADFRHLAKEGNRYRTVIKNTCTGQIFDPPKPFVDKTWQDSKQMMAGVFIENKRQLTPSLFWNLGLRTDILHYAIDDPAESFSEVYRNDILPPDRLDVSATSSLSLNLPQNLSLSVAIARSNRAPELSELFINHFNIGMDAYEYLGNPKLKSETNHQADLRIEKQNEKIHLSGDVFVALIHNYISAVVDTTLPRMYLPCQEPKFTKVFTNVDRVLMTGFELGADFMLARPLMFSLGLSYTYGQNLSWDEPLAEIAPFTLVSALSYQHERLDLRLNARFAAAQNRVAASFDESTTPAFTVVDFYSAYRIFKTFEVNFTVKNLTNATYVEHLSRAYRGMSIESLFYEPGISFNIGLRYIF